MPRPARLAVGLLVTVLVMGLVRMLIEPWQIGPELPSWFAPVVGGSSLLVNALLIYAIGTGRQWALFLSVGLLLFGIRISLLHLNEQSQSFLVVSAGQLLAQAVAYLLLFTSASRQWFIAARHFRRSKSRAMEARR
jgi:hypothetical protein